MTSKLYEMLSREYASEKGENIISIYGADERIYLSLFDKTFIGKGELINTREIDEITRKFFNRFYEINALDRNQVITLNPNSDIEHKEYDGHLIMIRGHFLFPQMEIWTGNRGNCILAEEQRQKYFEFVKEIYEKFMENARI